MAAASCTHCGCRLGYSRAIVLQASVAQHHFHRLAAPGWLTKVLKPVGEFRCVESNLRATSAGLTPRGPVMQH
jgi:hypothetical protein